MDVEPTCFTYTYKWHGNTCSDYSSLFSVEHDCHCVSHCCQDTHERVQVQVPSLCHSWTSSQSQMTGATHATVYTPLFCMASISSAHLCSVRKFDARALLQAWLKTVSATDHLHKLRRSRVSSVGNKCVPIQLAQCRFPWLTISNAEILIYFSNKKTRKQFYQTALRNSYGLKLPKCWLEFKTKK